MSFRERIENNPIRYFTIAFVSGCSLVISGLLVIHTLGGFKFHQVDSCVTLKEMGDKYVTTQKFNQQEAWLVDYRAKYFKADAENKILKAVPMWAIQIGGVGYQTLDETMEFFALTTPPQENSVFMQTNVYKFNDYYYIFKYDRDKTKSEIEENLKTIRLKLRDVQCDIVDLRKYCPSVDFVKAEEFTLGDDIYFCRTCN